MIPNRLLFVLLAMLFVLILTNSCKKDDDDDSSVIDAELVLSPTEFYLNDIDTAILYLTTKPEKEVTWQITGSPGWLEITPSSGTLRGEITEISIVSTVTGLNEGYHPGTIEIISNTAGKAIAAGHLHVGANPIGSIEPASLSFPTGTDIQYMTIENTGSGYLQWELNPSMLWVDVSPPAGVCTPGEETEITVTVDRSNMPLGTHSCNIEVITNSVDPLENIEVIMDVPEMASMTFSTDTVNFSYFYDEMTVYLRNSGNVTFNWNLTQLQEYIEANVTSGNLDAGDSVMVVLTADREGLGPGSHLSMIEFENDKGITAGLPAMVKLYLEEKWLIDGKVVDAEYDRNHDVIIAITESPFKLLKLDPESETIDEVPLSLLPMCVSVHPTGNYAAVGHDAKVSYLDLQSMTVIDVYNISEIAYDIVIAPNDYAYVFPATGQWTKIMCVNLQDGSTSQSTGYSGNDGTKAKLHPSNNYIYGADNGISPSDFEKYDITAGIAELMYDSPYHGDYSFGGDIWISDDGERLFARSRNVFISTTNPSTDMTYNGQLQGESYLVTLDHSTAANRIYAIERDGDSWDYYPSNEVRMYEAEYLNYNGSETLPGFMVPDGTGDGKFVESEGHFGFFNKSGTKYYVLVRAREGSGMLDDWAVATLEVR